MASEEADGLVEDFREALEGLQMNSRYEIQNLTQIARESTEDALAISQALQDHIKQVG
jgi:pre-mRNA cleavage complex 2 protein Pcf11